ncbi:hypothetical protein HZS_2421 [Henneguya salminicola]|nr:hypothetical protein HZS_2421 [Henneguya salminicola]
MKRIMKEYLIHMEFLNNARKQFPKNKTSSYEIETAESIVNISRTELIKLRSDLNIFLVSSIFII